MKKLLPKIKDKKKWEARMKELKAKLPQMQAGTKNCKKTLNVQTGKKKKLNGNPMTLFVEEYQSKERNDSPEGHQQVETWDAFTAIAIEADG